MGAEGWGGVAQLPALAFGSVFLLVVGLQHAIDRRQARLGQHLARFTGSRASLVVAGAATEGVLKRRRRFSTIGSLDSFLERQGFAARIDVDLARAALPLRVGEYLFIRGAFALGLALVVLVGLGQPVAALLGALAGWFGPALYVRQRQAARLALLNDQLVDALGLVSGGLRAGYSFLQGIEAVVRELPDPIHAEFGATLEDLRMGMPVEEALLGLARRVPTEDVDMVVTSLLIQRTTGGNLAEVLDNIALTIRERIRIRREVSTLTAQERTSSYVVGGLPIAAFAFLSVTNPDYLSLLFGTPTGQAMLAGAALLEGIGFYVIRRIIDIRL